MANPPARTQANLEVPPDLHPVYANLVRIAHSPADLVLDFAHILPGDGSARISARVIMTPMSAKLFYRALGENLARYEAAFGEISTPTSNLADQLFKPFQAPPDNPPQPPEEDKP